MTTEKEIQILQSLKGDTYFAQMFGDDMIGCARILAWI